MNEQQEKIKEARRKSFENLMQEWGQIATWQDFFDMIEKKMETFRGCGCMGHAIDLIMTQQAFVLTLKELPEEGDIKNIMQHMARLMVYEGDQKMGFAYIDDEEAQKLGVTAALAARLLGGNLAMALRGGVSLPIGADAGESNVGSEESVEVKKPDTSKLH